MAMNKKQKQYLGIGGIILGIIVIFFLLWYFCVLSIPFFPKTCLAGGGGSGTAGDIFGGGGSSTPSGTTMVSTGGGCSTPTPCPTCPTIRTCAGQRVTDPWECYEMYCSEDAHLCDAVPDEEPILLMPKSVSAMMDGKASLKAMFIGGDGDWIEPTYYYTCTCRTPEEIMGDMGIFGLPI